MWRRAWRSSSVSSSRPAGGVVDEEVVAGDVEGFGEADDGVGGGGRTRSRG
jgi:hypothetical protein